MKKTLLLITFLSAILNGFSQVKDSKCLILREGTFSYGKKGSMIVINGNTLTEYKGNYIIKKNLVWVNECEYNTIVTKIIRPKRNKRKVNGYHRGTIIWDRARNAGYDYIPKPKKMGYQKHTNNYRNIESVGDVLNVKINDVLENKIFYTASRNGKSWKGKMIKKKERKK
ncbi:hypothetical protein [Flavivirga eckloniae]|uniref:Uncharacterized protein n=1 Tax=Flavivirga eckloniae TaxID=1803846 RepID=A0A2K9PV18_9FLAO|nr:hypothetical protein [Flavivirga eckloniae]AUP80912.1 hypothetical protein C1H87_20250 [Flavivirga eckloniae]